MKSMGTPQGMKEYAAKRQPRRKWLTAVTCLAAVIVVFCTAYHLIMPAVTLESSGPYCGQTAHQHVSACYDEDGELICELPEHQHTLTCYSDVTADVETAEDWEATFEDVELTGNYRADVMSAGLTYNNDAYVVVVIDEVEYKLAGTDYKVEATTDGEGVTTLTVTIDDLKKITEDENGTPITIDANTIIYVYYTCTLNENAVIGQSGNPNTFHLTYSNNPNTAKGGDEDETGDTPDDTNIVFTYKLIVNKTDEDGKELTGATFTLSKWVATVDENGNVTGGSWEVVKTESGDDTSVFNFSGLDDGKYKLEETGTPAGYNTMDPIYIVIEATHDGDGEQNGKELTSLTAKFYSDEACEKELIINNENNTNVIDGVVSTGTVTVSVVNESGSTLPGTGGMGTTMLYVIGIILVAGAGILLVVRRRMSAEK